MKTSLIKVLFGATATAVSLISMTGSANALTLSRATLSIGFECNNDVATLIVGNNPRSQWQYVDDTVGDGLGGLRYELYGMGFMEDANHVYFAINTHDMPLNAGRDNFNRNGTVSSYNIGWTDLLINTTGRNLADAQGNLFGIHFGANSAGVSQVGLYGNVTATSVAGVHTGGVHEYLTGVVRNFEQSRSIPTFEQHIAQQSQNIRNAYQQQNWNFEQYLSTRPQSEQNAYQQQNWNFEQYLSTRPQSEQNAYQQQNWNLQQYLSTRPQSEQNAYQQASERVNWTVQDYLSTQSATVQQNYERGDSTTVNRVNREHSQAVTNARNTIETTTNRYNSFITSARNTVNNTTNNYNTFINNARNTVNSARTGYDRIVADATRVNNFNNTLFGSLSRDQGLAYFDPRGSHVIQSGTFLSNIEMLTLEQLRQVGYNTTRFQGGQTVAFRLSRSYFGSEQAQQVPEPTTILGLASIGLALASGKLRKRTVAE